jgi:hypothetical protein
MVPVNAIHVVVFYIFVLASQVLMVHAINSGVACVRYGKAVRNTPAGAEPAQLMLWDGLSTYHEPAPAPLSPH